MQRLPGVTRKSNRTRNIFLALTAVFLLLVGAWWAAQRLLGVEAYRASVIQQVEAATGAPCTIDGIALRLLPQPGLHISGLHTSASGVKLDVASVTANLNTSALLQGTVEVPVLRVDGLELTLPEDGLAAPAATPAQTTPAATMAASVSDGPKILAIEAPAWRVVRAGQTFAEGDLSCTDPLGPNAGFKGNAQLPGLSPAARAVLEGTLARAEGFQLAGRATLSDVDLAHIAQQAGAASALLNAELAFTGASPDDIAFDLSGQITASGPADVSGSVAAKAWWKNGEFIANDFTWNSPGLHLLADASRKPDGEIAINVQEADASKDGLALLLATAAPKGLSITPRKAASLTARDLLIGRNATGQLRWVSGELRAEGFDLKNKSGVLAENLSAKAHLKEGTIRIDEATAGGLTLKGDVTPTAEGANFKLSATLPLAHPLVVAALPPSIARAPKGTLTLTRAEGAWRSGGGLPDPLAIEGTLSDAELNLDTDRFTDRITALKINFSTNGSDLNAKAAATLAALGPVQFDGTCKLATRAVDGKLIFSLNDLIAAFVPAESAPTAHAFLAAYDKIPYTVAFRPPASAKAPGAFTLAAEGPPRLKVEAALPQDKAGGVTIGAITADLEIPMAPAAAALPVPATGAGAATVHFERAADGNFTGKVDLSAATLSVPPYLSKRSGSAVSIAIAGDASWQLTQITADLLGQPLTLTPAAEGYRAENLNLDLAALAPLFPEGSEAAGRVTGTLQTAPPAASVQLSDARIKTPSGIAIDEIDGALEYSPDKLRCETLHLVAYGSDFVLNGDMATGKFNGTVRGLRADLNALAALAATPGDATSGSAGAPAPSGEGAGLAGSLEVALDEVFFRKATLSTVKGKIQFGGGALRVDDLSAAAYGGTLAGALSLAAPGPAAERDVALRLDFNGVDLKIVDDLSDFTEPRGMYGPASGAINITTVLFPGAPPFNSLSGDIALSATDGSLGKAGASGKVLAALRTTELAQLQIPSLRDKGLSFTQLDTRLTAQAGRVEIQQFELAERTHTITAEGGINFPADDMAVTLRIQLLQGVRDIVGAIPILDTLAQAGGIYVKLTGSPSSPSISTARIRPLQEIRDQGGGLLKGVKSLIGR